MKMRRCEDEKMLRRRCEDEKMFYRPPLLEEPCAQTLSGKNYRMLEAGLNASLELQCRKTMEIRTKHVRAGFEAGLEGLKAMEIGANEYDKEGTLLVPIRFAFEAWPRPGLAWPRPGLAEPPPRLQLLKHATSCINIIGRVRLS